MFTPLKANPITTAKGALTRMSPAGINKKDLQQLLAPRYAIKMTNYLPIGDGRMEKRGGLKRIFDVAGGYKVEMIEKFTDDLWIFGYNTTVAVYQVSTDTVTDIKTDFTASGRFRGERAGDYLIVTNGVERPYRISRVLLYDAQTQNFTLNRKLTGGTSGATAVILEDLDSGTDGRLTLGEVSGTFQDNETITDAESVPGSATTDGLLAWMATEMSNAPIAKGVKLLGSRLFLFDLEKNASGIAYSESDTGSNPPFTAWTVGTEADDAGEVFNRNIGAIQDVEKLGPFFVAWGLDGKFAFTIDQLDSAGTISKVDNFHMNRLDFGGSPGALMTPIGLVYANENGFHRLVNVGQLDTPSRGDEEEMSVLLGDKFFEGVDVTNGDIVFDEKRGNILFTFAKNSSVNNTVVGYNIDSKAIFEIDGWNVSQWFKVGADIYFGSDIETAIFKAFTGASDDGVKIGTEYVQELNLGELYTAKFVKECYAQGFLSASSVITVHFDIYDYFGKPIADKAKFEWTAQRVEGKSGGWGKAQWGQNSWGSYSRSGGMVESFDGCEPFIREAQRVILRVTSGDEVPHIINWIGVFGEEGAPIRRRKMTAV